MVVKNILRGSFPTTVNKSGREFSALIANDKGNAAVENQLRALLTYMNEWIKTPNVYEQTGTMLEKTVTFFSYLEMFTDETELSLKNRFSALFVRNHDKKWGTKYDITKLFQQYFPSGNVYVIENTGDSDTDNLIEDGDFTDEELNVWQMNDCNFSTQARFSGTNGIEFNAGGTLSQTINLSNSEAETYFLHFFSQNGKIKVSVKNSENEYWNKKTRAWQSTKVQLELENKDTWEPYDLWFMVAPESTSVTIEFEAETNNVFVDYVRMFKKELYGSFTVITQFEGETSGSALSLAPGNDDPLNEGESTTVVPEYYDKFEYFDNTFMTGTGAGFAQDIYADLLDYVRSSGVKAYLELVTKDFES